MNRLLADVELDPSTLIKPSNNEADDFLRCDLLKRFWLLLQSAAEKFADLVDE
jgi:hypothetical protein